jgi:ATP-dependent protease HslVU (ClpYQ) peptidase subunit
MTTIAWDGVTLASDSACSSTFMSYGHEKISSSQDGTSLYAVCGEMATALAFVKWLDSDSVEYPASVSGDWAVLDYDIATQTMMLYTDSEHGMPVYPPFSMGSGSPYAQAAMTLGSGAEEAVEVAILLDPDSGGDVVAYSLME